MHRRYDDTRLGMSDTEQDWRDFRAKLIAQEKHDDASSPNWAYELSLIEQGSVVVSRHEHDFCYGLKQQYFHKSIMLVLVHEKATNGIILNRPTSLVRLDEDGHSWDLWFGGPVQGIHDSQDEQAFTCLHALTSDIAKRVSNKIIKDIQVRVYKANVVIWVVLQSSHIVC